jgi:hypothetical protein
LVPVRAFVTFASIKFIFLFVAIMLWCDYYCLRCYLTKRNKKNGLSYYWSFLTPVSGLVTDTKALILDKGAIRERKDNDKTINTLVPFGLRNERYQKRNNVV